MAMVGVDLAACTGGLTVSQPKSSGLVLDLRPLIIIIIIIIISPVLL